MPSTLDVVATGWKIAIAGSPLSDAIQKTVMHAYVDNSLTLPDMATIELSDPGFQRRHGRREPPADLREGVRRHHHHLPR